MIPLIAAAIAAGGVRSILGGVSAVTQGRRNRRLIEQAYQRGRERLDVGQADERQSQGERMVARGLTGGGSGMVSRAVAPGALADVTQAHDLGSQNALDLEREQGLAQNDLQQQHTNAVSENRYETNQGVLSSILGGANTAMNAYGAGAMMAGPPRAPSAAPNPVTPSMGGVTQAGDTIGFGGIDVVDPLGRGAWATGGSAGSTTPKTGAFNVFNGYGSY